MFQAALASADPAICLPPHLPAPPLGQTLVLGAGKAAASMALAVEKHWPGNPAKITGTVVTRYGHALATRNIRVIEAAHPIPDASGVAAAKGMLAAASNLGADDLLIVLISGGGSSLLCLPPVGLCMEDKQKVAGELLRSGVPIHQMNIVRKHLSAIKGGWLAAAAAPAAVVSLIISDVPGDNPAIIASGPTVGDSSTFEDALHILKHYKIEIPIAVERHLRAAENETPKPDDPRLKKCKTVLIAAAAHSLEAAARVAKGAGYKTKILGDALEGEARDLGAQHAKMAIAAQVGVQNLGTRIALISGGETTVTVRGNGKGGRNLEYLAGLALALEGRSGVNAIACDTDGIDGTEDNAGAFLRPDTLSRGKAAGLHLGALLSENNVYSLFHAIDDLVICGPTLTNVNDFRAILIDPV